VTEAQLWDSMHGQVEHSEFWEAGNLIRYRSQERRGASPQFAIAAAKTCLPSAGVSFMWRVAGARSGFGGSSPRIYGRSDLCDRRGTGGIGTGWRHGCASVGQEMSYRSREAPLFPGRPRERAGNVSHSGRDTAHHATHSRVFHLREYSTTLCSAHRTGALSAERIGKNGRRMEPSPRHTRGSAGILCDVSSMASLVPMPGQATTPREQRPGCAAWKRREEGRPALSINWDRGRKSAKPPRSTAVWRTPSWSTLALGRWRRKPASGSSRFSCAAAGLRWGGRHRLGRFFRFDPAARSSMFLRRWRPSRIAPTAG